MPLKPVNLLPYSVLTERGWEHLTNMPSYTDAVATVKELMLHADTCEYMVGKHSPSGMIPADSVMVGIYKRQGKCIRKFTNRDLPEAPAFYVPVDEAPVPNKRAPLIGDRPSTPVSCRAA